MITLSSFFFPVQPVECVFSKVGTAEAFPQCMCAHSCVMRFVYLQYPVELYIAPNRVCNLI